MRCFKWLGRGGLGILLSISVMNCCSSAQEKNGQLHRMVVELLNDKDNQMRSLALEQISFATKGAASTTFFASQLPKLAPPAQIGLLNALATRGDQVAKVDILSVLIASPQESVRVAAIGALGELGDASDAPQLLKLLNSDSSDTQAASKNSLIRLRGSAVNQSLLTELDQSSAVKRVGLIEIIVTRRAFDALPAIASCSVDSDAGVRRAAINALSTLGSAKHIPAMVQGVLKATKGAERDAAEKALVNLCNRLFSSESRSEAVLSACSSLDDESQLELLSTVARIGGAKALQAVEATMASTRPGHHDAGLVAFCNWPEPSITDKLAKLVASSNNPIERSLEFKSLVRLASIRDKRNDLERLSRFKEAMTLAKTPEEQTLVIDKCRSAYSLETVDFVMPFVSHDKFSEIACETIVEIAHHREVREPNKDAFDKALDRVIETASDPVVKDRAQRYKRGETWQRPAGK